MKIIKINEFQFENHENTENHRIQCKNNENNENQKIKFENL